METSYKKAYGNTLELLRYDLQEKVPLGRSKYFSIIDCDLRELEEFYKKAEGHPVSDDTLYPFFRKADTNWVRVVFLSADNQVVGQPFEIELYRELPLFKGPYHVYVELKEGENNEII